MLLYKTSQGPLVIENGRRALLEGMDWDRLLMQEDLETTLAQALRDTGHENAGLPPDILAPIGKQEVWAAGVTYFRSREARMEESRDAGADDFYARVYDATRPELFFKAMAQRVSGHLQPVRIRRDSAWNVPEPELTLVVNAAGVIVGYTIGNDMSSRDIEGENPLYLPQAKVYDGCCGLGPGILISRSPMPPETPILLEIRRGDTVAFSDETSLARLKRRPEELVEYLYRESSFPHGCFLLTGTGIIPPSTFTLKPGDEVRITIPPIGTLVNEVETR